MIVRPPRLCGISASRRRVTVSGMPFTRRSERSRASRTEASRFMMYCICDQGLFATTRRLPGAGIDAIKEPGNCAVSRCASPCRRRAGRRWVSAYAEELPPCFNTRSGCPTGSGRRSFRSAAFAPRGIVRLARLPGPGGCGGLANVVLALASRSTAVGGVSYSAAGAASKRHGVGVVCPVRGSQTIWADSGSRGE